jgi:signal transduction histidine kinase
LCGIGHQEGEPNVLTVEQFNIVIIAGASLGVLCSAGLALVSGPLGWSTFVLFVVCLAAAIALRVRRTRGDRKLLAELQEHHAPFGSPTTSSLTIASAALELVDYQTFGDLLEQALVTLLINTIKFSPFGGGINLEIDTNPQQKTVLTRILDQAPAVEPQDVPGLFDKFDGARTCARTAGGAGIALALVRQIIETVHGGSVLIESRQERGCCFGLRLPLYAPEPTRIVDELCIR